MFDQFKQQLASQSDLPAFLRDQLIGENAMIEGPFGPKKLIYADYVASGRALRVIESFVAEEVLPFYANSHTRASYCGRKMTAMREAGRMEIARILGAGPEHSVIFTGSGATAAINRLVKLVGLEDAVRRGEAPVVFLGPYEHHSNILPWVESGAEIIYVPEAAQGGLDSEALAELLDQYADRQLRIGSFSAASNVTGITTDVIAITKLLKSKGALSFWDYAGGAPYMPVSVNPAEGAEIDALFLSAHKFPGGPAATGILAINNNIVRRDVPSWPGGGTVTYVSEWGRDYSASIASREEAGTPNIIGDIRAALCFLVKEAIGADFMATRQRQLVQQAMARWNANPNIHVLGNLEAERLPIFSFLITDAHGRLVPHNFFTRALSDLYGIQARSGCACAGPYGHILLNIDQHQSQQVRDEIKQGNALARPGWVRLNFSYLFDDQKAGFIIDKVEELANSAGTYLDQYQSDPQTGSFCHIEDRLQAVG
ncbi:aminotransferase class V-fold PLP-dependent enzyme [Maritalea mediterranea]|uniref:Aminotransferase class V-fold PLP-dependent enzyme n=1 Tax=Maritalea mediterranea TaxID=2909667 RepID=A0ABS9E7K9_9HYPH|nr:aminotransferase class V-fold PLP-dependent enzyme [Maritalea mediterranea]MCF4097889.1 aminotransferase class V-fold PLP-dependent enzyme [Maritalea mediterranea]